MNVNTARRHRRWPAVAEVGRTFPEVAMTCKLVSNPLLRARHQDDVSKARPNSLKLYNMGARGAVDRELGNFYRESFEKGDVEEIH